MAAVSEVLVEMDPKTAFRFDCRFDCSLPARRRVDPKTAFESARVDLELQYSRARWYDPSVKRWISEDPIGFAAGDMNLARYVVDSPINLVAPSGHEGEIHMSFTVNDNGRQRTMHSKRSANPGVTPWAAAVGVTGHFFGEIPVMQLGGLGFRGAVEWLERYTAAGSIAAQDDAPPSPAARPAVSLRHDLPRLPQRDDRLLGRMRQYLTESRNLSLAVLEVLHQSGRLCSKSSERMQSIARLGDMLLARSRKG
jgi:RHS repeat-associated protein